MKLSIRQRRRRNPFALIGLMWQWRELLISLIIRNLKSKYKRSVFGFLWTMLGPLSTVGVLTVVFTHVVRMPLENFWAFLLSGYFVWVFFTFAMSAGTYVLLEHAQLSRSIAYPKEVLVIAAALSRLVEFLLEIFLVIVVLAVFHHHRVPAGFLFLPWLLIIQLLISIGIIFPIATLSVFYQDVQHGLPIVLVTLFYITPIFYPFEMVAEPIKPFIMANPFAGVMRLYHQALYYGQLPSLSLCWIMTGVGAALLLIGYIIFLRFEDLYAEIV